MPILAVFFTRPSAGRRPNDRSTPKSKGRWKYSTDVASKPRSRCALASSPALPATLAGAWSILGLCLRCTGSHVRFIRENYSTATVTCRQYTYRRAEMLEEAGCLRLGCHVLSDSRTEAHFVERQGACGHTVHLVLALHVPDTTPAMFRPGVRPRY